MPCIPFDDGKGARGFICTRGARRAAPCFYCRNPHERLCDHPVGALGETCDRKLCRIHAHRVGKDADRCPDHVEAKEAPPVRTSLVVCTGNVHRHRGDDDALDVTIMSGGPEGRPFAPSLELFRRAKSELKASEARALDGDALLLEGCNKLGDEDPTWADLRAAAKALHDEAAAMRAKTWGGYRRDYLAEMLVSSNRPPPDGWADAVRDARRRGVVAHPEAWSKLLRRPRVVLLCFEPTREFCHRGILAGVLVRMGASDGGELPPAPIHQLGLFTPGSPANEAAASAESKAK